MQEKLEAFDFYLSPGFSGLQTFLLNLIFSLILLQLFVPVTFTSYILILQPEKYRKPLCPVVIR